MSGPSPLKPWETQEGQAQAAQVSASGPGGPGAVGGGPQPPPADAAAATPAPTNGSTALTTTSSAQQEQQQQQQQQLQMTTAANNNGGYGNAGMYGTSGTGYGGAYGGYGGMGGYGMGGYGVGGYGGYGGYGGMGGYGGYGGMGMGMGMMPPWMLGRFPMLESAQMLIGGFGMITQMVGMNAQAITHAFSSLSHMITHFGHSGAQLLGMVPLTTHRVGPQGENMGPMSEEEIEMERKRMRTLRWVIGLFSGIVAAYIVWRYARNETGGDLVEEYMERQLVGRQAMENSFGSNAAGYGTGYGGYGGYGLGGSRYGNSYGVGGYGSSYGGYGGLGGYGGYGGYGSYGGYGRTGGYGGSYY